MAEQTPDKEVISAINGFNKPSQEVPGVEMGFHQPEAQPVELKLMKTDEIKKGFCISGIIQDDMIDLFGCVLGLFFKKREE